MEMGSPPTAGNLSEFQKLEADIYRAELETCRKLENWGASLFFAGIGLLAKQLIEWDAGVDATKKVILTPSAFVLPALVGLAAFVFLRIVNYRSRFLNRRLYALAKAIIDKPPYGWFGWSFATMPLLLGYAISWYFADSRPKVQALMVCFTWIGAGIVFLAVFLHAWRRRHPLEVITAPPKVETPVVADQPPASHPT